MGIKLHLKSARELKAKPVSALPPTPANEVTFDDDKLEKQKKDDIAVERRIGPHGHKKQKKTERLWTKLLSAEMDMIIILITAVTEQLKAQPPASKMQEENVFRK